MLAVCSLLSVQVPLSGCGGPSGLIVGDLLQNLTGDVNSVVANTGAQAQAATLSTAGAVQDAISNAESAFATDLNKGINEVNDSERRSIEQLQTLVNDLQRGIAADLKTAISGAQQLINTLPFTNKNPQVTSYSPQFAAPGSNAQLEIRIEGNFVYAFQRGLTPTLKVAGVTYRPNLSTTQELGYSVPSAVFSASASTFTSVSMELDTPYESGLIFKSIHPGTFRLLVTVLPPSPVRSLTLTNTTSQTGTATKMVTAPPGASTSGGGWHEDSFDCNDHSLTESPAADQGWAIVPSSVQIGYSENKNPNSANVAEATSLSRVTVTANTKAACFLGISDGSGDITFFVTFTEQMPTQTTSQTSTPLKVGWGDQLVEPVSRGQWRIAAELFNGQQLQFDSSNNANAYVSVIDQGTTVQISTPSTASLAP